MENTSQETKQGPVIEQGKTPLLLRSGLGFVWEVAKTVLIAVVVIVLVRTYLFKPFYVKGASMEPNFHDDEYLIINELDYRFHQPARGDVIVLQYPRDPKQFFIKRLIGLPGEKIDIADGTITITNEQHPDGMQLNESAYLASDVRTSGDTSLTLGPDQFFVMGDNRPASLDSRSQILGPIDRSAIVGRVWFRVWPFSRATAFHTPSYATP